MVPAIPCAVYIGIRRRRDVEAGSGQLRVGSSVGGGAVIGR